MHYVYATSKNTEAATRGALWKEDVLKNFAKFTGKHLLQRPEACNFIKKETLTQVFSCEFCEISKNTFLQNTSERLLLIIGVQEWAPTFLLYVTDDKLT